MKVSTKNIRNSIRNLEVDLEDIYYTFPKKMTIQDIQYFEGYITNIRMAIRDLDKELDISKEMELEGEL